MKDYLTEAEITKIEQFCADEAMYDAVKKCVLAAIYTEGTIKKGKKAKPQNRAFNLISSAYSKGGEAISNEALGAELRGLFEGVNMLEQGFAEIKLLKTDKKGVETPYNEAI